MFEQGLLAGLECRICFFCVQREVFCTRAAVLYRYLMFLIQVLGLHNTKTPERERESFLYKLLKFVIKLCSVATLGCEKSTLNELPNFVI